MIDTFFALIPSDACAHVAVPEATEQAMRYYRSGNLLWMVLQAWTLLLPALFLITGFSGKLETFCRSWGKRWFWTLALYLIFFILIYQLLSLPFSLYAEYIRQHAYGLSTQTLGRWFNNYGIETVVTVVSSMVFVWIFYLLLKKSPRRWWFYSALVGIAINFIMQVVQPIWIDPLFNEFGPMKNKQLEERILALAARAGIEHGRVFEVAKSADTKMINAYVTGIGKTNRIVLWDTTIEKMTPDEIIFVMGHEMGHYVLHHIWWGLIYYSLLSFAIFYGTFRLAEFLLHRYKKRFGFKHLYNFASLPLLLLSINIFLFFSAPLFNVFSRYLEREADRFGLEITQDNKAAAEAFIVLQNGNLANPNPGPLYTFWRASHPPLKERIEFCNSYCPWERNQPLKYGKYFKTD